MSQYNSNPVLLSNANITQIQRFSQATPSLKKKTEKKQHANFELEEIENRPVRM